MKKQKTKKSVKKAKKNTAPASRTALHARKTVVPKKQDATPLSASQIEELRDVLSQKRDELLTIVQKKKEQEIEDIETGDEADIATRSVEKEMLFELTDSEKQTVDMIEAALRKIEKGIYGSCESCRKSIPRLRLSVMPWARYCINCQAEQEFSPTE